MVHYCRAHSKQVTIWKRAGVVKQVLPLFYPWVTLFIGGSMGGVPRAPSRSNFFHFHAVLFETIGQIRGRPPSFGVGALVWEILDTPLVFNP